MTKEQIKIECQDGKCRFFFLYKADFSYETSLWGLFVVKITNPLSEKDYSRMARHRAFEEFGNPYTFLYHSKRANDLVTDWFFSVFPANIENLDTVEKIIFINGD